MNILAQFKNNFNGFLKVSLKEGTNALLQTISSLLETYDKELAALRNKDIYKLIKRVPRTILTT